MDIIRFTTSSTNNLLTVTTNKNVTVIIILVVLSSKSKKKKKSRIPIRILKFAEILCLNEFLFLPPTHSTFSVLTDPPAVLLNAVQTTRRPTLLHHIDGFIASCVLKPSLLKGII